MKVAITLTLLLLSSFCSIAQNAEHVDPPELVASHEEYMRNIQQASIPVLERYLRTLDGLKQQFTNAGRMDDVPAIEKEIKDVQQELDAAKKAIDLSHGDPFQLLILSASFGNLKEGHVEDATENLRKALRAGKLTVTLNSDFAGGDPAPYVVKQFKIIYSIGGQRKEKVFTEGHELNLKDELN